MGSKKTVYSGISPDFIFISTEQEFWQVVNWGGVTVAKRVLLPTDETLHFPSADVIQVCVTFFSVPLDETST